MQSVTGSHIVQVQVSQLWAFAKESIEAAAAALAATGTGASSTASAGPTAATVSSAAAGSSASILSPFNKHQPAAAATAGRGTGTASGLPQQQALAGPPATTFASPVAGSSHPAGASAASSASAASAAPTAAQLLPDSLFDALFDWCLHQVVESVLPSFLRSRDFAVYAHAMQQVEAKLLAGSRSSSGAASSAGVAALSTSAACMEASLCDLLASCGGDINALYHLLLALNGGKFPAFSPDGKYVGGGGPPAVDSGLPAASRGHLVLAASAAAPLRVDQFEQMGCIGTGSYGAVHVWRHKLTGVCYAVKSMDKRVLKHKSSVHTVVRELACTLAVLDSPYVCGFEFSFTEGDLVHMGMRMMWRGDLERWLLAQPQRRFEESTARFYAAQLVVGLKHLHSAGVIHRDLKASNCLIDDQGHVRITDFGLAVLSE